MTLPRTMTAIEVPTPGGPEALIPTTVPLPALRPGEVLIRVAAAGLNGADLSQRRGRYDPPPGASPRLGLEASGEVVALGDDTTRLRIGDRVAALCNGGGYAEYVAVPEGQALPVPEGYGLVEAAGLPETFFTVMQTLVMRAGVAPGMTVLVHGASGGIGAAAILTAKALGASVLGIVSSAEKAGYVLALGAAAAIDRTHEDIVERTLALTDGRGADRIVDVAGGPMAAQNIEAAARFGHIVVVSTQAGSRAEVPLHRLMAKQLTLSGSTLRPQTAETKAAIADRLRTGIWPKLPHLPRQRVATFALADAAAAHRAMEAPDHHGKTLLVTDFAAALPG